MASPTLTTTSNASAQPGARLKTIAVDLTPVLPGGENGGAKVFVLELIRELARKAPETQFVLLTQSAAHEELATLDRPNVSRRLVLQSAPRAGSQPNATRAKKVAHRVPASLLKIVGSLGYRVHAMRKRKHSSGLLKNIRADLLFCPFTAPTYSEPGIPTVSTIYDLQFKSYPAFFSPADVEHRNQTFKDTCAKSTALAAISDYSRLSAIKHGHLSANRIRTIHLRIADRLSVSGEASSVDALTALGLTPGRYFVYPANFWKHKNHEVLFTAFGMACADARLGHDVKLVCTGAPGERRDWLESVAARMNMGDRVMLPGYLPSEHLGQLMAHCTAMIFPSLYEGFGLPVLEAMNAGIPVACSNLTSLPEVAKDAALLFDPRVPEEIAQAMVSLTQDQDLRLRLIEAGRIRAREFANSAQMADEYWNLFEYAVAHPKHSISRVAERTST